MKRLLLIFSICWLGIAAVVQAEEAMLIGTNFEQTNEKLAKKCTKIRKNMQKIGKERAGYNLKNKILDNNALLKINLLAVSHGQLGCDDLPLYDIIQKVVK